MSSDKILRQDKTEGTYVTPAMLSSLTSSTLAAQVLYHFSWLVLIVLCHQLCNLPSLWPCQLKNETDPLTKPIDPHQAPINTPCPWQPLLSNYDFYEPSPPLLLYQVSSSHEASGRWYGQKTLPRLHGHIKLQNGIIRSHPRCGITFKWCCLFLTHAPFPDFFS